jgi:predicted esterase
MAAQLAIQSGSSWKGLILIGARVRLDTARLAQNGIRRVLLASGDFDMVRDDMRKEAGRAEGRHGIEVRYESLGRVGHGFAPDMDGWMGRALAWVTSRPQASNSDIAPGSAGR